MTAKIFHFLLKNLRYMDLYIVLNLLETCNIRRQIDLTDFWYILSKFWFYSAKPNFLGKLKELYYLKYF